MPQPLDMYTGFPSLRSLLSHVEDVVVALLHSHREFCSVVQTIATGPVPPKDTCCAVYVSRRRVRSHAWRAFLLSQLVVGAQRDLVQLLHMLQEVQQHTGRILPVLVNENIFCHICRIVHGQPYAWSDFGNFLGRILPLSGIWHHYKYAVTSCYCAFFLFLMYVVYGKLREGHELPMSNKLIFKEGLFASLLVVADDVRSLVNLQVTAIFRRATGKTA